MLLSDAHAANFVSRRDYESLLGNGEKFDTFSGTGLENCDGCYLHLDRNRSEIVRSGQTTAGFEKRSKQHERYPNFKMQRPKLDCSTNHIVMLLWQRLLMVSLVCGMTWIK
jgi:hypothetical protein